MLHRRHELAVRHLVAGELVGDDHRGHVPQALEQSAEKLLCGHRVSARLDQNVEHVAVLVDRAPQVPRCAVDLDDVKTPLRLTPTSKPTDCWNSWIGYPTWVVAATNKAPSIA